MQLSNYVARGCGHDWTAELGDWEPFITTSWVQTLIAFFILVVSARVLGKFMQLYTHQLAGYMLLGFVCTSSYMLGMVRHEHTVDYLHYICVFCKAFIAFETGTHLANVSELKQYWHSIVPAALGHVVCVFCTTFAVYDVLIRRARRPRRPPQKNTHAPLPHAWPPRIAATRRSFRRLASGASGSRARCSAARWPPLRPSPSVSS